MDSATPNSMAAIAGIAAHVLYFRVGEHHMYAVRYIQVASVFALTGVIFLSYVYDVHLVEAFRAMLSIEFNFAAGVFLSLSLYRLFFHPLRSFPGPLLARWTAFWYSFQMGPGDAYRVVTDLHQQYGDYFRIGPQEIVACHPDAVQAIYGPGSRCKKGQWYEGAAPHDSMHTTRDRALHDKRRRIWSPAFSDKALRGYEERIVQYADKLLQQVSAQKGEPLNASKWFHLYSYDVMGDLAFSKGFGMLESGNDHWAVQLIDEGMGLVRWQIPIWFLRILLAIPGLAAGHWKLLYYSADQINERAKTSPEIPDVMSSLLAPYGGKKPKGRDLQMLEGDVRLLIVAGSDTTAATLTFLFYHLARDPEQIQKLRAELQPLISADGNVRNADIQHAEHLNGCINEALRLNPPVPTAIHRKTPPEGLQIGGTFIPGDTEIWAPQYVVCRREDAFSNALEFYPERWYSDTAAVKNKGAFAPFLIGPYGCIGKPLAMIELRTVTARLVMNYDISLAPGEDGHDLLHNSIDHFTLGLGKLNLVFKERSS